ADQGVGDTFAAPRDATSMEELETRLSTLARKQNRHRVYDHLSERAGLDLTAPEAWLLLRIEQLRPATPDELAPSAHTPRDELETLLDGLRAKSLVEPGGARLTPKGEHAGELMTEARCDEVRAIVEDWDPEHHGEVLDLVRSFARSLART